MGFAWELGARGGKCDLYLSSAQVFPPYVNFARRARDSCGIISFNWDLVCETALNVVHSPWSYSVHSPVPVLKPHGSINWSSHLQQGLRPEVDRFMPISPGMKLSFIPESPFQAVTHFLHTTALQKSSCSAHASGEL